MKRASTALLLAVLLAGCVSAPPTDPTQVQEGLASREEELSVVAFSTETYDPFNRANQMVYRFNAHFDEAIHRPVARAYVRALPQPVRTGVGNFFSNLGEIGNTTNHLLQARPAYSARSAARFVINTTLGVAGLFDVATRFGMPHAPTGFANTLGHWGVGAGPYLVLPVLGPSSVRDGAGSLADFTLNLQVDPANLYSGSSGWALGTLLAVDRRARIAFRYYQSGSPFEYELMRFLYTRMRAIEIGIEAPDGPVVVEPPEADTMEDPAVAADQLPVALPGQGLE